MSLLTIYASDVKRKKRKYLDWKEIELNMLMILVHLVKRLLEYLSN